MNPKTSSTRPSAVIFGCAGLEVTAEEVSFFKDANPLGFILFARNCDSPDQVRHLTRQLRESVDRPDAPVLIDQEGGRVQRLTAPYWRVAPAASKFVELAAIDLEAALEATRLNARLMAEDLRDLGITVDCAPVLDVPQPGAHDIIGDRAHGESPEMVSALGRAVCEGLLSGGVLPVIKHIPGHGRASVDSHISLPRVKSPLFDLRAVDFAPFKALSDMPWAMTAHIVYEALDRETEATSSSRVIEGTIRNELGFEGVLVSDDLSMKALAGEFKDRASNALAAGCDIVLHCNGDMNEMKSVIEGCGSLSEKALSRVTDAETMRSGSLVSDGFEAETALVRLTTLLERVC